MKLLNEFEDFNWHKKELDVAGRYNHDHKGNPEKYPCKVISEFENDPNGPYTYWHKFVYQQAVKCSCCGNESLIWPEQADC